MAGANPLLIGVSHDWDLLRTDDFGGAVRMDDGASGQNPDFNRRARLARVRSWYALTAVPPPTTRPAAPRTARRAKARSEIAGTIPTAPAHSRAVRRPSP